MDHREQTPTNTLSVSLFIAGGVYQVVVFAEPYAIATWNALAQACREIEEFTTRRW